MYVYIVHYHVNSGQMSNAVCGSDPPPPLTLSFSQHPSLIFPVIPCFSSLCFCPINCLLSLSLFTLLMLVEGLRANAVNVSGFKALQMSAVFFQSAKTKPRLQQICQLQVRGQVCVSYFPGLTAARNCCKHAILLQQPS